MDNDILDQFAMKYRFSGFQTFFDDISHDHTDRADSILADVIYAVLEDDPESVVHLRSKYYDETEEDTDEEE
jgi:hypothetical protein